MLWAASVPGVVFGRTADGAVIRTVCDGDLTIQGVEEQPGTVVKLQQHSDHINVSSLGIQMFSEQPSIPLSSLQELFSPLTDLYAGFLSAYFQITVERKRPDLIEKVAQKLGNSRIGNLARSLLSEPLPSVLATLQAKVKHCTNELSNLLQGFYYSTVGFPYSLFQFAETNHSTWILHGLATYFDVGIRVVYWNRRIENIASTWIYPNTDTRHVMWLYLFRDFTWSIYNTSPSNPPHTDLNLWPVLRDLQSVNHLPTIREFELCIGPREQMSNVRQFDLVLAKALTHFRNQLYCAFCSQPASVLSPCCHGFCTSCLAETQHYSCPVCPAPCFLPNECYTGQVLENSICCGACWKCFPLTESYPGNPFVQALHKLPVCGHICCSFCIEMRLRSDNQTCPLCPEPLPVNIEQASSVQLVCSKCKENKDWLANFELTVCRDHRICTLCQATLETANCPVCVQPFLACNSPSELNCVTSCCSVCCRLTCNSDLYRSDFCRCEVCITCLCETELIEMCKKCKRKMEVEEMLKLNLFVTKRRKDGIFSQNQQ